MERLIAKLLRKVATRLSHARPASRGADTAARDRDRSTVAALRDLIGRPRFTPESHERTTNPGVASGLAVTGMGGDVLYVEAGSVETGKPGLTLTGQLGDVMKESAQIALSYVRSHASALDLDPAPLEKAVHVHVPAGAVPKDGPSAGVTMVTALASMASWSPGAGRGRYDG